MKLLTFLAKRFSWRAHTQTLGEAAASASQVEGGTRDAVVVFLHAEVRDQGDEAARRALRHVLKHVKWLAGKRGFQRVVLHSFTHLGAENSQPEFARDFVEQVAERLESSGYEVLQTPFGWFCEWTLEVYGESLAKVWKEI